MSGHVIGAPTTTATRRSVILSADGSDARLTFAWTTIGGSLRRRVSRQRHGACRAQTQRLEERATVDLRRGRVEHPADSGFHGIPRQLLSYPRASLGLPDRALARRRRRLDRVAHSYARRAVEMASSRASVSSWLEVELQRKLHRPVVDDRRRDPSGSGRVEVLVREAKARVIEQVERVPPELDVGLTRRS